MTRFERVIDFLIVRPIFRLSGIRNNGTLVRR